MKGIILAGGTGTRLYPLTLATSKQLLPIYDKPMIYYPLSILMQAGIKDILIITTPEDKNRFINLLGDGSHFGINISYEIQPSPDGLAQAFVIGEKFLDNSPCAMILGDNIFFGDNLSEKLKESVLRASEGKSTLFAYKVRNPERFGVITFDKDKNATSIEEKPAKPQSNYCVTGLYFYPGGVSKVAKTIKKSLRGEYEITDLNNFYLDNKCTFVECLNTDCFWLDTGTYESLSEATNLIKKKQEESNHKICCPEEIAYHNGWINKTKLIEIGQSMKNNQYGQYLLKIAQE